MADNIRLTRDILAKFLPNHEAIRQFERLFATVDQVSENPDTEGVGIDAGSAAAQANQTAALIYSLGSLVNRMNAEPAPQVNNSIQADYIELRGNAPSTKLPGTMDWSNADDTLVINHTGGVHQQVGLETYVRFQNLTGVTIANGTSLGYAGGAVAPYLADGAAPMLNIIGVATQDIPANAFGRATVFGGVNGIDTTGAPVGETWLAGDALYASPTAAGKLTKVKPTAPAWAIPMAVVTAVSATEGRIFVRPIIDQPLYYGEFIKTAATSPAAINTAYPITFNSANIGNGLSIGTPASRIVASFSGLFCFNVRVQMASSSASVKNAFFWFRKNGVDIPNTCTKVSLDSGTSIVSPSVESLISLKANDYIELMWASDSTNITLTNFPATAFCPASPAVMMVATQEQQ